MAGGWDSLGLLPELVKTCEDDLGILPTAIQDECIPLLLGGGDVMGSAETGSGKTAAFALPVLQLCVEFKDREKDRGAPQDDSQDERVLKKVYNITFVMSTQDRDLPIAFHPDGRMLRLQSRDATRWAGCRCSAGVSIPPLPRTNSDNDKRNFVGYSYECTVLDNHGVVRVGWSSEDASLQLGTDSEGFGFGGTGMKSHAGKYEAYPSSRNKSQFSKGDVIGCHLKIFLSCTGSHSKGKKEGTGSISFSKNGHLLGEAFVISFSDSALFPALCIKNAECEMNFGTDKNIPFKFDLPENHLPLSALSTASGDAPKVHAVVNPRDAASSQLGNQKNSVLKGPMALIIQPTRDLAQQSYRAFVDLGRQLKDPPVQAALLVGGIKPTDTMKLLDQNRVDILVGTPPIIASYMKKGAIQSSRCRFLVLDEADELISTDSVTHIRSIYGRILASTDTTQSRFDRLQVCFFSATLHSKEVRDLAETLCHQPLWVDLRGSNDSILPDTVHHCVVHVSPSASPAVLEGDDMVETDAVHRNGKLSANIALDKMNSDAARHSECVKQIKPRVLLDIMEKFSMEQVLIFCRTNLDCDLMEKFLRKAGGAGSMGISDKFSCRVLAGMRTMDERQQSLKAFKEGEVRILICTDVAARGIDIRNLPFVINCTLPDKPETYVHRVGRVGRADRMGLAISLVSTVKERVWFCRKGKKPPCSDTRDFDKGGNCIWYDEPKYVHEIEKLLRKNQVSISYLQWPDLKLPPQIQAIVRSGGYGEQAGLGGALNPEVKEKMEKIERQVKQLAITETSLQTDFWRLKSKFNLLVTKQK